MLIYRGSSAELYYEVSGDPSGTCIVLSNSLGTDMRMWKRQLPVLEQQFLVLRYDMRGHGRSSVPPGPYTIPGMGADIQELIAQVTSDPAVFCGLSIGGVIGQWIAANAPSRLKKLILCDTAAKIGTPATWNARILKVQAGGMSSTADDAIARWFTDSFRKTVQDETRAMHSILVARNPDGYTASCAAIRDMDQQDLVESIKTQTLIVAGACDTVTTIADAEALRESISHSTLVSVPAAHISAVEAPAEFNSAILHFLQEDTK